MCHQGLQHDPRPVLVLDCNAMICDVSLPSNIEPLALPQTYSLHFPAINSDIRRLIKGKDQYQVRLQDDRATEKSSWGTFPKYHQAPPGHCNAQHGLRTESDTVKAPCSTVGESLLDARRCRAVGCWTGATGSPFHIANMGQRHVEEGIFCSILVSPT